MLVRSGGYFAGLKNRGVEIGGNGWQVADGAAHGFSWPLYYQWNAKPSFVISPLIGTQGSVVGDFCEAPVIAGEYNHGLFFKVKFS